VRVSASQGADDELDAAILRMPEPERNPYKWALIFIRSIVEGDRNLERQATEELERLGYKMSAEPSARLGYGLEKRKDQ
jgi:hypothetical protein